MLSLKQYLMEIQHDVTSHFIESELDKYKRLRWKSREKLIMMPIKLFLQLARTGVDSSKEQNVLTMLNAGEKFDIPYLYLNTHTDPDIIIVNGHEGRHRARALLKMGYTSMPVLLKASTLRWSEQTDPKLFDYDKHWPTKIQSENGDIIPFFVSREQSTLDFPY